LMAQNLVIISQNELISMMYIDIILPVNWL